MFSTIINNHAINNVVIFVLLFAVLALTGLVVASVSELEDCKASHVEIEVDRS